MIAIGTLNLKFYGHCGSMVIAGGLGGVPPIYSTNESGQVQG